MKTSDLLKRIEALEARIRELEARPVYVPYAVPTPYQQPWQVGPWRWWESPTCTGTYIGPSGGTTTSKTNVPTTYTSAGNCTIRIDGTVLN